MAKEIVEIVIPSSPVDRKAVADGIKEISNSLTRIEGERTYIKESIDALSEKYNLDKKYLRRMARDYHKDQFEVVTEEDAQYSDLFEVIMLSGKSAPVDDEDEDLSDEDLDDAA
jgi:hypothetical protein